MDAEALKARTKAFALRIIKLCAALPRGPVGDVVGRQLLRSGTSVGSNYRSACRAKSAADFVSKMGWVEEEADESVYWLELLAESGYMKARRLQPLMKEATELTAIASASRITARQRNNRQSTIGNRQSPNNSAVKRS